MTVRTEAGKRLLFVLQGDQWANNGTVEAIAAIEAEARAAALREVAEKVRALQGWNSGTLALDCVRRSEILAILEEAS